MMEGFNWELVGVESFTVEIGKKRIRCLCLNKIRLETRNTRVWLLSSSRKLIKRC